jgi:leucyl aminopeptidase
MYADQFYQPSTETTVPVTLLTQPQSSDTQRLSDNARHNMQIQAFHGKSGEICLIHDDKGDLCQVFIGLGHQDDAHAIAQAVTKLPAKSYVFTEPVSSYAMLMWSLSQYKFDRYKENLAAPRVLALQATEFASTVAEAEALFMVRDLINTPANDMGPAEMADALASIAYTHQAQFEQWIGDELISDNFPAIHAVGRASATPPRLLSLTWGEESHPKVTLIGKGVCFDSGGLDLKTSPNMRLMKKDMGGAAQVIGLAKLLMARELPIRLQVYIPAVENAIGSNAYRPGDILTMRNGLTVEIDNTDAEGRLIVADALVKACEESPELIIDFTTLTGAARVAVGTEISAMFTNSENLAESLTQAAEKTHDPIWRLPLFKGYNCMLESSVADLVNSSPSAYAGAITAALFLQHFISNNIPWVHFDIMAWNLKSKPGKPEGGEAMAIRAVADYLIKTYGVC